MKEDPVFVYDQGVIVTIDLEGLQEFGTEDQHESIHALEQKLATLLPECSGIDGDEFGEGECIVYLYGPSADDIFSAIESELKSSPFNRIDITLQYGRPEDLQAKEKSFSL